MSKKIVSQWGSFPDQRSFWKFSLLGGAFAIAIILAISLVPAASGGAQGAPDQSAVEFVARD